ncbi:M23 family metallopeptidase [Nocardia puris]|nr:M23 family metallopeptidase [Nocardia puris]MBF6370385.1 M23 family metallopeptidase [Nocardia puris]MBF6463275.1 M23 family metallopeptidase [Nocardia puris]
MILLGTVAMVMLAEPVSAVAAPSGEFGWPLRPRPAVERRFDPPDQPWLPGHRGVDLAGAPGQSVYAAGSGIVVFAGTVAGKEVVSIDHPGGLRTTYEPVRAEVPVGRRVARGTPIGTLEEGHPGCAASACLHWGLRREAGRRGRPEYLDPLGLLRLAPLRLYPVEAQ